MFKSFKPPPPPLKTMSTPSDFANLLNPLMGGSSPFGLGSFLSLCGLSGIGRSGSSRSTTYKMLLPLFLKFISKERLNAIGEGLRGLGGLGDYLYGLNNQIERGDDLPSMKEMRKELSPFIDVLFATYMPFFVALWNEKALMCIFEPYLLDTLSKNDPRLADFLRKMEPSYRKSFRLMRAYYPKLPTFVSTELCTSLIWKPHCLYLASMGLSLYVFLRNDCGSGEKGNEMMKERLSRLLKIFLSTATILFEPISHAIYVMESVSQSCADVEDEKKENPLERLFAPSLMSLCESFILPVIKKIKDLYLVLPNLEPSKSKSSPCKICFPAFGEKFTIVGDDAVMSKVENISVSLHEMMKKKDESSSFEPTKSVFSYKLPRVEPPIEAFPPEPFSPHPTPKKPLTPFTFGDSQPKDIHQPKDAPTRRKETNPPTLGQSVDRLLGIVKGGLNELRTEFSTTFNERPPSPPAPF